MTSLKTAAMETNCTSVFVFFLNFFSNPAAEIMLSMLFNTLLKITPHNKQKIKKKKRKSKVATFTTIFAAGYPSSS